jgi:hypothetical protein
VNCIYHVPCREDDAKEGIQRADSHSVSAHVSDGSSLPYSLSFRNSSHPPHPVLDLAAI